MHIHKEASHNLPSPRVFGAIATTIIAASLLSACGNNEPSPSAEQPLTADQTSNLSEASADTESLCDERLIRAFNIPLPHIITQVSFSGRGIQGRGDIGIDQQHRQMGAACISTNGTGQTFHIIFPVILSSVQETVNGQITRKDLVGLPLGLGKPEAYLALILVIPSDLKAPLYLESAPINSQLKPLYGNSITMPLNIGNQRTVTVSQSNNKNEQANITKQTGRYSDSDQRRTF